MTELKTKMTELNTNAEQPSTKFNALTTTENNEIQ